MTKKQLWESKLAQRGKHLKEAYDDFASAVMSDGTKVYASASTRSTRTYNYEDVEFEFGARKGFGTYRWMNRPWQRFDFAEALKNAMIDAGVDKEFARECIDKSGSLRSAVEYFAKNYKVDKKEVEESYSKQELLDAVMNAFGYTKSEALEYIKKASDKTKQELVKGFRQDAKRNFYDESKDDKRFECEDGKMRTQIEYEKWIKHLKELHEIEEGDLTVDELRALENAGALDESKDNEDDDKVYQIKYWLTEEDREEGFSDIFIDSFDSKQKAIMTAKKMVDRGDVASVEVFDAEDVTEQPVYFYDGNEENNDSLKEEKNNDKGAKIASIIASALNKQGGHGPFGNEEVVADENTITLVSQAGLETYKFNNDGSVDNLSIDDMIKTMLEDGDIEESEIEDIREEYSHFNSIKDLLQSGLTWFMELPEKLIIKKVEKILDEEEKLEEAIDLDKHVWEGWTVQDFIDELEPLFDQIMSGHSWKKPFKDKAELKAWCIDNQPYYKRYIPGVVEYFFKKMKKNENLKEALVEYDPAKWESEDIELHKSIDWKERNYEDFLVEGDTIETEVILYSLNKSPRTRMVTAQKYLRANAIYPPYYEAKEMPFEDEDGVVGGMFDGNKHNKTMIMDRYETVDLNHYLSI